MAKKIAYSKAECLRCHGALAYLGTRKFHEGTRAWPFFLAELGELFVNREEFEIYACSRCGHVEFFVEGVGDELRAIVEE